MNVWVKSAAVLLVAAAIGWNQENTVNVNSRYTVESVEVSGEKEGRLTQGLRDDLRQQVGQKFNPEIFQDLAKRIRRELKARTVVLKVLKGDRVEHVKVVLEVLYRTIEAEGVSPKFVYHSRQGWTGDATVQAGPIIFGVLSDQDMLIERFAGLRAGLENRIFTRRVRVRLLFETFHEQWHPNTLEALADSPDVPGVYRNRYAFQPQVTLRLTNSVEVRAGFDFQRFQTQFPAALREGAHAAVGTLRYRNRWTDSFDNRHDLEAGYNLRAATRSLDSDYVYTRHAWQARYQLTRGRETLIAAAQLGRANGRAPLFERFSIGNSTTLRGWSKFDADPIGGTRMAHGTLEYRHRIGGAWAGAFYDAGSVWDRGQPMVARHAVGFILTGRPTRDGAYLTLGFPIRADCVIPILTVGARF
jgi:hypothetical protein